MKNAPDVTLERADLCFQAPPSGLQRRKYQRYAKSHSTYLGLIACVIQKSPNRRLTFCQIMDNLEPFVSGDRKGLTNNIRVCLSSNDCFVKVPVHPEYPNSKKNFWKVDETCITPKILRRHFKGMLHTFPDLASRLKGDPDVTEEMYTTHNPPKTSVSSIKPSSVAKFSGPFSIESILKKDTRSLPCPKSRPNLGGLCALKPEQAPDHASVSVFVSASVRADRSSSWAGLQV
ncbi:forkhead box protein H1-like [Anguilla anguilla]|uniref:forkhead box protein H1-like n=1 Tax=Anguilla anguilla TaxID=7936 RepID=UPI0015AC62E2|nr:forkhead box protein H1-like [Anguilla anguilla]